MKNHIKKILLGGALMLSLGVSAQQINPITQAVLKGYNEILDKDPKDYETLYQRGSQYYQLSMYDKALFDIIKALEYTPAKEKAMRLDELDILSNIYIELKEYDKALEATDMALSIEPDSYALLYQKGNICLYRKDAEEAYRCFARMRNMKSRSQEAYFGMARADIMMGKLDEARDMMRAAEQADPTGYITYCRLGDLSVEMGDDEKAAADYLSAFSLSGGEMRPLQSLITLGNRNFEAVRNALEYAISRSENTAPLYFLEANIAYNTGNYVAAYDAFKKLLDQAAGREGGVYASMARCCLALNKLTEAKTYAGMAMTKDPSVDNALVEAEVLVAAGEYDKALTAVKKMGVEASTADASMITAKAYLGLNNGNAALIQLNDIITDNPENIEAQMIRAYINEHLLNNGKQAAAEYNRISQMPEEQMPGLAYKALAKNFSGKKLDADAIIEKGIKELGTLTKDDYYWIAVYYSQSGNLQKAVEMIDKAVSMGYQNYYNIYTDKCANLNLQPIRHLLPAQPTVSTGEWQP